MLAKRFLLGKLAEHHRRGWFALRATIPRGAIDSVEVSGTGLLRLEGWAEGEPPALEVATDGRTLQTLNRYRVRRPDVARALGREESHFGFIFEFIARGPHIGVVSLRCGGMELCSTTVGVVVEPPHYAHLFDHPEVLHREGIYGVGPPSPTVDAEVLTLARGLPGSILDFGCGSGALVRALRQEGRQAYGIELERGPVIESLRDDVRPHITLYGGGFPSPLGDGQCDSVLCSEVLEHIADWRGAVAEIGRLCKRAAVITVPDASAIPEGFPHRVVPWHLLEATHFNFFTQRSLQTALAPIFPRIWFARNGAFHVNGTKLYTSLVAHCER